ncbi:MAG: hypothetical protein JNM34_05365 [Chthonomonadaceae bacterium]|nr:hypothetical protein [Chthonomonadaceae bacterium]
MVFVLVGLLAAPFGQPDLTVRTRLVQDTYLDLELPDNNFGRDQLLLTGPGTAVLVKFPSLRWEANGCTIKDAKLTFTIADGDDLTLTKVGRVKIPWEEGEHQRLMVLRQPQPDPQLRGGATWLTRRFGSAGQKWTKPGAGADCTEVEGWSADRTGRTLVVKGLDEAITMLADDPSNDFGLRLEFSKKGALLSSEDSDSGPELSFTSTPRASGPKLVIESLLPSGKTWTATVHNVGDEPATGVSATWKFRGEEKNATNVGRTLPPGDRATVEWQGPRADPSGPDVNMLSVSIKPGGQGGSGDYAEVSANGFPVRLKANGLEPYDLNRLAQYVNLAVFGQSKTTFSPEGCRFRIAFVGDQEPGIDVQVDVSSVEPLGKLQSAAKQIVRALSPYRGLWSTPPGSQSAPTEAAGWLDDTRDDTAWTPGLLLPQFPWGDPKENQPRLTERGNLSRAETAAFQQIVSGGNALDNWKDFVPILPAAAILSFTDMGSFPIGNASVSVTATKGGKLATEPFFKGTTTSGGKIYLPSTESGSPFGKLEKDGSNSWMLVKVTRDSQTEETWLPAWELATEAARGNVNVPTVEFKLTMPDSQPNMETDLAKDKVVTGSPGMKNLPMASLVDGQRNSMCSIAPGEWIEIDLSRDRVMCGLGIETEDKPFDRFSITVRLTGDLETGAIQWIKENDGLRRSNMSGIQSEGRTTVNYVSRAVRVRYLRLTNLGRWPVRVSTLSVRGVKAGT